MRLAPHRSSLHAVSASGEKEGGGGPCRTSAGMTQWAGTVRGRQHAVSWARHDQHDADTRECRTHGTSALRPH
eukprot:1939702-Alexandrium_andersonii.AAC.1